MTANGTDLATDNERLRDALRFARAANERQAVTIAELRESLAELVRLRAVEMAARVFIASEDRTPLESAVAANELRRALGGAA